MPGISKTCGTIRVFEDLRLGRPILAYILPDTPIERILSQSGEFLSISDPIDTAGAIELEMQEDALSPKISGSEQEFVEAQLENGFRTGAVRLDSAECATTNSRKS
jgi:hypothetical protein